MYIIIFSYGKPCDLT